MSDISRHWHCPFFPFLPLALRYLRDYWVAYRRLVPLFEPIYTCVLFFQCPNQAFLLLVGVPAESRDWNRVLQRMKLALGDS